jgi:hypothetical protein
MNWDRFRRQTIALVAAYAMALQALFAAFVPPAVAAHRVGAVAALCSHDADSSGQPADQDLPCAALCAAMAQGIAGSLPPDIAIAFATPYAVAALAPGNDWITPRVASPDGHAPRGPPRA